MFTHGVSPYLPAKSPSQANGHAPKPQPGPVSEVQNSSLGVKSMIIFIRNVSVNYYCLVYKMLNSGEKCPKGEFCPDIRPNSNIFN